MFLGNRVQGAWFDKNNSLCLRQFVSITQDSARGPVRQRKTIDNLLPGSIFYKVRCSYKGLSEALFILITKKKKHVYVVSFLSYFPGVQ